MTKSTKSWLIILTASLVLCLNLAVAGNDNQDAEAEGTAGILLSPNAQPLEVRQQPVAKTEAAEEADDVSSADENRPDAPTGKNGEEAPFDSPRKYPYERIALPSAHESTRGTLLWESFEAATMPPEGWSTIVNNSWATWWLTNYLFYDGSVAAAIMWDWSPQNEWLISPALDLSAETSGALSFWWAGNYDYMNAGYCSLQVWISFDGGTTFDDKIWDHYSQGVFGSWNWNNTIIDLTPYAGQSNIAFAFVYSGMNGSDLALDAIEVNTDAGRCCYGDPVAPDCADLSYGDCEALGNMVNWTMGSDCTDPCGGVTPGNDCNDPHVINIPEELPFADANSTCGRGDNYGIYSSNCLGQWSTGEDMFYQLVVSERTYIEITMDAGDTYYTGISLSNPDECPGSYCPVSSVTDYPMVHVFGAWVEPGTYTIMIDSWAAPTCYDFNLSIGYGTPPLGRCCYGDPMGSECGDLDWAECSDLGGLWDREKTCADNPCFVLGTGDDCSDPLVIDAGNDLPFVTTNTTQGRGNDYDNTCLGSYDRGEEIIYRLDVAEAIDVTINLDSDPYRAGISVSTACPADDPGGATCIAYATQTPAEILALHLEPGSYFINVDYYYADEWIDEFTLSVAEHNPQIGDNCDLPISVKIPEDSPFITTDSTCGRGNYYEYTCLEDYDGQAEIIYQIEISETSWVRFDMDPLGMTSTGMALSSQCPPDVGSNDCIARVKNWSGDPTYLEVELEPGFYYLMIDSWDYATCIPQFNLTIEVPSCEVPPNDLCENVSPKDVPIGTSLTLYGDNSCSTNECPGIFDDYGHVWEAFSITEKADVAIEFCGTSPEFQLVYEYLLTDCPCDETSNVIFTMDYSFDACGDGNGTLYFAGLEPGTYYLPILGDHPDYYLGYYMEGPYTVTIHADAWDSTYCNAGSGYCGYQILNVAVSNIDNPSTCTEGYSDYTDIIGYMDYGQSYTLVADLKYASSDYIGGVWIDWNQDHDFNDPGEFYLADNDINNKQFTAEIDVPDDAPAGPTRMRVREHNIWDFDISPCYYTSNGEVEDYTIVVGTAPPTLTIDPPAIDFGTVEPGDVGSAAISLGVNGTVGLDFTIDWTYGAKSGGARGGDDYWGSAPPEKPSTGGEAPPPNPDVIRQGGDNIASAVPIDALPAVVEGVTVGFTDDYDETCPYMAYGSPDVVYSFTPASDMGVNISLCNSDYDTKLYVYENEHTPGAPFACNDDACPGYRSAITELALFGGNTYYIVVDGYGAEAGAYTLEIEEAILPDPFECPLGAVPEAEACGEALNEGCNENPQDPSLEPIECGDIICGTAWADAGRDTDWFEITVDKECLLILTASAEFPMQIAFVEAAIPGEVPDCGTGHFANSVTANERDTVSTSLGAVPGTYWVYVTPTTYYDHPCGVKNQYWFKIQCLEYWLNAGPTSGTIPAGGSTSITVGYDASGLDVGTYEAELSIWHTGAKATEIVPVTINVWQEIVSGFTPDPIHALDAFLVDPADGIAHVGNVDLPSGYTIADIDATSVAVNGLAASGLDYPAEGYVGVRVDLSSFVGTFGILWDQGTADYSVEGSFNDATPFSLTYPVAYIGHTSGDANLDSQVNVGDAVFVINYVFNGGLQPRVPETADANCDGSCNVADAVRLINYIFRNGSVPCHP